MEQLLNPGPKQPQLMPGPQFDEKDNKNWFRSNYQKLAFSAIVLLLAIGGYLFYRNYQERQNALRPVVENIGVDNVSPSPTPGNQPISVNQSQPAAPAVKGTVTLTPEVRKQDNNFVVTATKGNGVTHLARQAIRVYIQENTDFSNLKKEQKIYAEDYIVKKIAQKNVLKTGDEIPISQDLIKESLTKAQSLSDAQIKNLGKYVPLVPSL